MGVDDQNESGDKKKVDKFEINVNFFDNPGSLQQIYLILFFKLEFKVSMRASTRAPFLVS